MAVRTGILGDEHFKKNCMEYQASRLGVFNADFQGDLINSLYDGIKTPKYQRSAPKPQSLDVLAVNQANLYKGNKAKIARDILQQEQTSAREFRPPPVKLKSADEQFQEDYEYVMSGNPDFLPLFEDLGEERKRIRTLQKEKQQTAYERMIAPSRGTQIVKQTISSQTDMGGLDVNLNRLMLSFRNKDEKEQKGLLTRLERTFRKQNINPLDYNIDFREDNKNILAKRQITAREAITALFARNANVNLENIFEIPTLSNLPPVAGTSTTGTSTSQSVAGTSTQASQAPTIQKQSSGFLQALLGQGTPETATSSTAPEVQKK
jgi:hypothetical protein